MSILDENLEFLNKHHPRMLNLLNSIPSRKCKTEPTRNGSLTLIYSHENTPLYLHSKFDPEGESLKIIQKKNLEADHFIVLGLGLGYHIEKIFEKKDKLARVLLIEPDMEIVRESLNTFPWHRLLKRRDFFTIVGPDIANLEESIFTFINIAAFETLEYIDLPSEARIFGPVFQQAKETIDNAIRTYVYDYKTRLSESFSVPRNILKNYPSILETKPIAHLQNIFTGIPGFIVSAGPSLDKNVLYLKKIRERAVILTVDTALKPLLKRSIHPHFTAVGDPSYKNYLHLQGTETQLKNYLLAEAGVAHKLFKDFQRKIFTLSIGKDIVRILETHSEPLGELAAWGSVISIAVEAAIYMGLNPITFIGQDFAYTDSRNHCRGTSWEETHIEYSPRLDTIQRFEKNSISGERTTLEVPDIFGNRIVTSDRLILYKNYLTRVIGKFPQITFINSSEGGILTEIPYIPLPDVIKKYVYTREKVDFNRLEHIPNLNTPSNRTNLSQFLEQSISTFKEHLQRVKTILTKIETLKKLPIIPLQDAPALFNDLEETQNHIYQNPENGNFLEMWSTAPMYNFIKKYKQIRDLELHPTTIRQGIDIYENYFRNLKPVVEDIIKHLEKMSRELRMMTQNP